MLQFRTILRQRLRRLYVRLRRHHLHPPLPDEKAVAPEHQAHWQVWQELTNLPHDQVTCLLSPDGLTRILLDQRGQHTWTASLRALTSGQAGVLRLSRGTTFLVTNLDRAEYTRFCERFETCLLRHVEFHTRQHLHLQRDLLQQPTA